MANWSDRMDNVGTIDAEDIQADPGLVGFTLLDLATHKFAARKALIWRGDTPIFREGNIGEIYAERGTGKTWVNQTLALIASSGASAMGFSSPEPCRVLYVDGEMASDEIRERFLLLCERMPAAITDRLVIVAADWQEQFLPRVDTVEGQAALEPFVKPADLIIFDNRSCLFDPESEKDPSAWQPAQDYLLSLRRRGKAVLVVHHSNRQGGARGHSKPEDPMDILIKLARPQDYSQEQGARFVVTFEKSRGVHGPAVAPFEAALTVDGWRITDTDTSDSDQAECRLRDYLHLAHAADERPKSFNEAFSKVRGNRNAGLKLWGDMKKRGELVQHPNGGFYLNGHA